MCHSRPSCVSEWLMGDPGHLQFGNAHVHQVCRIQLKYSRATPSPSPRGSLGSSSSPQQILLCPCSLLWSPSQSLWWHLTMLGAVSGSWHLILSLSSLGGKILGSRHPAFLCGPKCLAALLAVCLSITHLSSMYLYVYLCIYHLYMHYLPISFL